MIKPEKMTIKDRKALAVALEITACRCHNTQWRLSIFRKLMQKRMVGVPSRKESSPTSSLIPLITMKCSAIRVNVAPCFTGLYGDSRSFNYKRMQKRMQ
jgi:hypothetical protein